MADGLMYARVEAVGSLGLGPERSMAAMTTALRDLAIVESLQLIHGKDRGLEMYWERGGSMRADAEGNAWVLVPLAVAGAGSRAVMHASLHTGRGSTLGSATWRRTRWWELLLECGHVAERSAKYTPVTPAQRASGERPRRTTSDVLPPPRSARCSTCLTGVKR
jgi:hypothetical protein